MNYEGVVVKFLEVNINGIHLYYRIRDTFNVIAFADRSEEKRGYVLCGLRCIDLDELEDFDKNIRIIVSIERPKTAISALVLKGFRNVCTPKQLSLEEGLYNDETVSIDSLLRVKCMIERGFNDANKEDFDVKNDEIFEIIEDFKERHRNENC